MNVVKIDFIAKTMVCRYTFFKQKTFSTVASYVKSSRVLCQLLHLNNTLKHCSICNLILKTSNLQNNV